MTFNEILKIWPSVTRIMSEIKWKRDEKIFDFRSTAYPDVSLLLKLPVITSQ